MSYSEHFRRKILAKLEEGYSIRAVAAQFEMALLHKDLKDNTLLI